jgi:thiol-disulfide isomerase/thioredoxin
MTYSNKNDGAFLEKAPKTGQGIAALCASVFLLAAAPGIEAAGLAVGMSAPDFTFTSDTPMSKPQKLSDYRGKPVALHFWATWCGPCIRELPLIAELTASKADALTVLAVNCAEQDNKVSAFLSSMKLRLNLVMDRDGKISRLYNITAIPHTFMIDEKGVIRSIQVGSYNETKLNEAVAALLALR